VDIGEILTRHRHYVIKEWIERLHLEVSKRYCERPLDELFATVSAANDANFAVIVQNDFSEIDAHIKWITKIRLEGSFSLSEVQNAYELYRTVLLPILTKELTGEELLQVLQGLNKCLFYTITKFSNYFQSLHEKQIKDYAQNLEGKVEKRTKELAESEAKYRVLIEEINDGYFVNQKGVIVFANKAYCDMHGYTLSEVMGRPYTDFIAPESLGYVKKLYEERISVSGSQDLYIYSRLHKNRSCLPTENKVKIIIYQGEYAAAGICRDITERMEMERRIRESERLANIGQLTTSLAHEIRNPLSSVKVNIQILLKNTMFDGNDKRRIEIMSHEITRLEKILSEMLDFARPARLNLNPVSINDLIDSCLEILDERFKEKDIAILKRFPAKQLRALMDSEMIEQAIINILLNSIEVLTSGGKIAISTKQELKNGKSIKVEVIDNGIGIHAEDLPYIFDPFFSKKAKGTGLGLYNVKRIVEAHGGQVHAENKKPRGMRIWFTIPGTETP
jgi:PAS domain S-box-containing protein